jgi:hypothetical protein
MGSHAFMLDPEERWKVIHYVKSLAFGDDFTYADPSSNPISSSEDMGSDINISLDSQATGTVNLEINN